MPRIHSSCVLQVSGQLTRRVGELPQDVGEREETLWLEQLENLGTALLDFSSMADLQVWLEALGD